ncbi:MAG: MvaI/BcnI family restriction endonuclease [bacterium]
MEIYSKEELIKKLIKISKMGWIPNARKGNQGGIGNTLEDLLGIEENNLPVPNAAEWELKTQRANTSSLTTLFHFEPSPRAVKFVPQVFLPKYGWGHQEAGEKYKKGELSFRQTISCASYSDRGFTVKINRKQKKVLVSFDSSKVGKHHKAWLKQVKGKGSLGELNPQPYWGFDDLEHKAGTKLLNCFYVQAETKKMGRVECYWYKNISMLSSFSFEGFLRGLEKGLVLVDFDARTGHNHGTKFRLRQNYLPHLYKSMKTITK